MKFLFYPSDAATHRTNRHPQKCIHTERRDQNHLLCYVASAFMTTFPQLVCLFKTLVNQVAFNLAIYWLLGEVKGNLCTADTMYIAYLAISQGRPLYTGSSYTAVSRKVVLQTGKSLRDQVEGYYG